MPQVVVYDYHRSHLWHTTSPTLGRGDSPKTIPRLKTMNYLILATGGCGYQKRHDANKEHDVQELKCEMRFLIDSIKREVERAGELVIQYEKDDYSSRLYDKKCYAKFHIANLVCKLREIKDRLHDANQ